MLAPLRSNAARTRLARVLVVPAPTNGINARDPLSDMDPRDAVKLINYLPKEGHVESRRGFEEHGTGAGSAAVDTLMTFHDVDGVEELFAGANGNIYDVTSSGSASSVYSTSITNNRWQWINFSTTSQMHILAFNGADTPLKYDGTNWGTNTISGSGLTATDLINAFAHKERVWLIEKNSLNVWYLASQAIGGSSTKLPLTGVFNEGGQVVAGGALSISDSGSGIDDLWVVITDNGEAAVYSGTDPASDFALIGVYRIGNPIGHRCVMRLGGDLFILTTSGVISMRQMLAFDRAKENQTAITYRIAERFNGDTRLYSTNFGWQAFMYPKGRYAIFNVPVVEGNTQRQWVQNTITGAWTEFHGQNANCWGLLNDELYFGGNGGIVYKADTGRQDDGGNINGEIKGAFNYARSPGQDKIYTEIRPYILASGNPDILLGVNVDFDDAVPTGTVAAAATTTGRWGVAEWSTGKWGGLGTLIRDWQSIGRTGTSVAPRMKTAANGIAIQVNGFDILYEPGGVL